jgi:hypothetical protein
VKFPEALLGIDSAFDHAMILLDDVCSSIGRVGAVDRRQIRIDDAWMWMQRSVQSLAKWPFGGMRIAGGRR